MTTSTALAIRDEPAYLATVEQVRALAEQISTVRGAQELAGQARAAEVWARRVKLGEEKVQLAVAARIWAERRAGQLIAADVAVRRGGSKSREGILKKIGVTAKESSRFQKLAEIDKKEFDAAVEQAAAEGNVSTSTVLKRAGRSKRDKAKKTEREAAEAEARAEIAQLGGDAWRIDVADLRSWDPGPIDCIICDPPYITGDAVDLHSAVADFAVKHLPEHGALAVMTWQPILPAVLTAMQRPELVYRWAAAWMFDTSERTPERGPRVFDGWKPILVFHKNGWTETATYLYDVIVSRNADKESHAWGQSIDGFRHLVRAFSLPGEVVCDPFAGGGTTAIAALAESRRFVGCDIDEASVTTSLERIAA